jgi:selenocysteine-specific elongation factor
VRHLVLGTAGHIDHGKSALVEALTGTDPDRLKEEKQRGITIELGFADLQLDPDHVVSLVDVPGHERFVRHMVAGATGVDAVMLVVAADQAVQPQTREHLDICALLGLSQGIIALTKCDLVDSDLQEVAEMEVRDLLEGTFLEDAPVLRVSAKEGAGLTELKSALTDLFDRVEARPVDGVARLPVDRSFVLKGFGTVVTGTLASGRLKTGQDIAALPGRLKARIRGLQVHKQAVEEVVAGQRAAVNLQGVDCEDVPRGLTLAVPGSLATTRRLWARLELLPDAPEKLLSGGRARFHQGTWDGAARIRRLRCSEDGENLVEIYLEEEAVVAPGDRFILRRPAPLDTLGGGVVIDIRPPAPRTARRDDFDVATLEPEGRLESRLVRAGAAGRDPESLAPELALDRAQLETAAEALATQGTLIRTSSGWIHVSAWRAVADRAEAVLASFHEAEPLLRGMPREELRSRSGDGMSQDMWRRLLASLAEDQRVVLDAERVSLIGHEVVLSASDQGLAEKIEGAFRDAGLDPPGVEDVVPGGDSKGTAQIVELLVAGGALTRIQDGRLFHSGALEQLREKLRAYARESTTIDVAAFKELAGVTRKNAIPLLEQLDTERVTRREGNLREILEKAAGEG